MKKREQKKTELLVHSGERSFPIVMGNQNMASIINIFDGTKKLISMLKAQRHNLNELYDLANESHLNQKNHDN